MKGKKANIIRPGAACALTLSFCQWSVIADNTENAMAVTLTAHCKIQVGSAVYSMLPKQPPQLPSNNCGDVLSSLPKKKKNSLHMR